MRALGALDGRDSRIEVQPDAGAACGLLEAEHHRSWVTVQQQDPEIEDDVEHTGILARSKVARALWHRTL